MEGSLRHARDLLGAGGFCEQDEAALLQTRVLLDLGSPEQATEAAARVRGRDREVAALRAEIAERVRPRTADERGRARDLLRQGLARPGAPVEGVFLEAWKLNPPNGLALIEEGQIARLAGGSSAHRAALFFERGVAELERETGLAAHAGVASPPACVGHFSNYLRAEWLPDGLHATIACNDGVIVARVTPGGAKRIAQTSGAPSLDLARLPRLVFVGEPPQEERDELLDGDRVRLPGGAWSTHARLPEGLTFLAVKRSRDGAIVFGIARPMEAWWQESLVVPFDARSGRVLGRTEGGRVRELEGGRFSIGGLGGVQIVDRAFAKKAFIAGEHGDLSPDGKLLLFTQRGEGDETYHPVYPWLRDLETGQETDLRPLLQDPPGRPAAVAWARVAPLSPDDCAGLGTMTTTRDRCVHPAVTIGGRAFGSNDDVACSALPDAGGRGHAFACLDPRGPVEAAARWDPALVCRVGPHVLPLGVCAHLLSQ